MRTKAFWADATERAIKTFAQALIAVLTVGTPLWDIPWVDGLGVAATAAVLSVLTSVASAGAGTSDTASVLNSAGGQGRHHAD